jgi:hypothetical protein
MSNNNIDIDLVKEKVNATKKSKQEEVTKKLELLATKIRNSNTLADNEIRSIMQNLLDYRKLCVSMDTVEMLTTDDNDLRMDLMLELL